MAEGRLPTGIRSLDALLRGGLEEGAITELFGEGGTGKSNLCLWLTARVALSDRWVVYVDTEGLSLDRLAQIAQGQGGDLSHVVRRLLLTSPKTLEEQERAVERASALAVEKEKRIGLVVVDSATLLYRLQMGTDEEGAARQSLSAQMADLLHAGLDCSIPILITNQVWRDVETRQFEPIGGSFLNHVAKTIVRLERAREGWRRAVLLKHRSVPDGGIATFRLTDSGIVSG
ncbi:MAG: DNA repair and recombination protein RadB [Euryarchaeota archaeon]|nr:DNA repair and recombination protein RadB [Euryarchaeota archaeon]MDE1836169.1 DNA repair and recombination protein RadB [Euryarchaeota archaeon]MDE1881024.1 DNA repair and recombination protein RadB [Euryarchaeota archaeon]MDE2045468.1 DNA repair and recombination protein RadB [Thermoplasmata archaeon]